MSDLVARRINFFGFFRVLQQFLNDALQKKKENN